MVKKIFNWLNVLVTGVVFLFIGLLGTVGVQFDFLNVFEEVVLNYNITDIYYSQLRDKDAVPYEDRIVLVNIGGKEYTRRDIARQIAILSEHQPKVIGVDVKFFGLKEEDPIGDFQLAMAIQEAGNVILASEFAIDRDSATAWDTLLMPPALFADVAMTTAYVNVGNEEFSDFTTWRTIPIREKTVAGQEEPCFAVQVARTYDTEAADAFMARGNDEEYIYYKGNLDKYTKLDVEDVLDENFLPELITDKIVLMGYMGNGYTDYFFDEDKFYTPLNEKMVGRGVPDMYGVVVHANIVSMILEKNYVNAMPQWLALLLAVVICFLNVALFLAILQNPKIAPYYGLTKVIQLLEILVLVTINIFTFALFSYIVDVTLAVFAIIVCSDLTEIFMVLILNPIRRSRFSERFSFRLTSLKLSFSQK